MNSYPVLAQTTSEQASQPEPIKINKKGPKLVVPDVPRDEVICFALYTVQDQVLKLSAQLYPLREGESREVHLEINRDGDWARAATEEVDGRGWMATFRVEDWDHSRDWQYRVVHAGGAKYAGRIRRDPSDQEEIVVAAFTGNSNRTVPCVLTSSAMSSITTPICCFFRATKVMTTRDTRRLGYSLVGNLATSLRRAADENLPK